MKMTTRVWAAVRNVGDANESPKVVQGQVQEIVKFILLYLGHTTLAKRIDLSIGRTEEEVLASLNRRPGMKAKNDPIMSELDQLVAGMISDLDPDMETENVA